MSNEEVLARIALGRFEARIEHSAAAQVVYVLRSKRDGVWVAIVNRIDGEFEVVSMNLLMARVKRLNQLIFALQTFVHEEKHYVV